MQLNHIFRSRDLVKKNERKIAKLSHGETPDDRFRDRGFTSPKVHDPPHPLLCFNVI